ACKHGWRWRLSKQWDFVPNRVERVIGPQRDAVLGSLGVGDLIFYCIKWCLRLFDVCGILLLANASGNGARVSGRLVLLRVGKSIGEQHRKRGDEQRSQPTHPGSPPTGMSCWNTTETSNATSPLDAPLGVHRARPRSPRRSNNDEHMIFPHCWF